MADDAPKPRKKAKKRQRALRDEPVRYLVAIEKWDWSYSFSLDGRKDSIDPYMEFRHVEITGWLLHPINRKVDVVELHLLPGRELDQERRQDHKPNSVGSLSLHNGRLIGLIGIPKDSLTPILHMLIADRFRFADMGGAPLRHRRSLLNSFRLETHIDEDDMPSIADESHDA